MENMNRERLEKNIAANIASLRKACGMTQAGLAERIGYSDKSVSKWERGEGVPDVICLKQMADLFGVSVDALLLDDAVSPGEQRAEDKTAKPAYYVNHLAIALISMAGVWLLAVLAFIILRLADSGSAFPFVIALPVTMLLAVIFNAVWGNRTGAFLTISALVWSILFLVCWICRGYNLWLLMVLGLPATVIVWLSCRVRRAVIPEKEEE